MLRRRKEIHTQVHKLIDAGLFGLALWLGHYIRQQYLKVEVFGGTPTITNFDDYFWLLVIVVPSAPLLLDIHGFYNRPIFGSRRRMIGQVARACAVSVLLVISVMFLMKETLLARSVILLFGIISFVAVVGKEELVRRWRLTALGQEQIRKRFILLGTREDARRVFAEIRDLAGEVEIVAQLDLNETSVEQLLEVMHQHSANGLLLSAQHTYFGQVEKAIQACEVEGVEAWLMADFFKTQLSHTSLDEFYGRPMLVFKSTPPDSWQNLAKQMLDVAGAAVLLVALSPLLLGTALAIRLTSPGPVMFKQKRSGLNGRPFTMLKFRSMVTNAEQRKSELEAINEMSGPVFKLTNDPRVTKVGRFLRRYSIDELPQLINVLRGEMSLVGPRPLPVDEVLRFDDLSHRRRLSVRPGLTCLWQISGRNEVSDFKDWVRLDLEYIDNWSFWLDLKILIRTVPVVLMGTGAR